MKAVGEVKCPKVSEDPIAPGLLRNCAVCFSYAGETKTHIYCNYPIIKIIKKGYEPILPGDPEEWESEAMEIHNSLMEGGHA